MKKQGKSGSPKKRAQYKGATAEEAKEALRNMLAQYSRAQRSLRLLMRVIAWLMQHRDEWSDGEAKIPLDALNKDVDVGLYSEPDAGHLLVVPAPPFLRTNADDMHSRDLGVTDEEMDESMVAAAARPDAEGT